ARAAAADTGRRARAAGLALRIPARSDSDPSLARRPDADLRSGRLEPERRDPLLRGDLEQPAAVPHVSDRERGPGGQGAVREAAVSEVPRPRRDSEGSADGEPRTRSANGVRPSESRLAEAVAEGPGVVPAGHAHDAVLARLPQVALSGDGRQ